MCFCGFIDGKTFRTSSFVLKRKCRKPKSFEVWMSLLLFISRGVQNYRYIAKIIIILKFWYKIMRYYCYFFKKSLMLMENMTWIYWHMIAFTWVKRGMRELFWKYLNCVFCIYLFDQIFDLIDMLEQHFGIICWSVKDIKR